MNSLLYYYNNVQKMAAYRQAKRLQRGVKLGYEQSIMSASTTKFVSAPISIGTSDFSIEFYGNTYGSYTNKNPSISNQSQPYTYGEGFLSVYQTESGVGGIEWIIFEKPATGADLADSINLRYKPIDPIEKFHFVITRQGTTVKAYINGELKATKEQSEVKDLGDLQLAIANSSDVGFVRAWNYALSADEIATLYNNGDPMGYVVPKAMRERGPEWAVVNNIIEIGLDDTTQVAVTKFLATNKPYLYELQFRIDEFEYIPDSGYRALSTINASILGGDVSFSNSDVGKTLTAIIKTSGIEGKNNRLYFYVGNNKLENYTTRNLKISILSLRPVGLLAEYLPQNMMYGRDDKAIATSWLDSAKQLPLSDEYMEPLFQSIGGYDMTANGAPEILYNE